MSDDAVLAATPVPVWLEDLMPVYAGMGVAELLTEFKKRLAGTVEHIRHMAYILRQLEHHGVDLDEIQHPWMADLRRVAYGQLLPGLLLTTNTKQKLLVAARSLPLPDQARIVNDDPIPVVVLRDGVGPEPRLVRPSRMENWQIRQVFGDGKIRSEVEQINHLDNPKLRRKRRDLGVVVDRKNRRLLVTGEGIVITASQLAEYLREFTK